MHKLQSISIMRVLAMLMIVAFHSVHLYTGKWWQFNAPTIPLWEKVSSFLDAIDLPMFVFISGFLFGHLYINKNKYRNKKQFVLGKFRRLIVPYLFWGMFMTFAISPQGRWTDLLTGSGHLWFLLMLFNVFITTIWLADYICINASPMGNVLLLLASFVVFACFHTFSSHHFFLCLHSAFYYLPFYIIGIYVSRYRINEYQAIGYASVGLMVSLFLWAFYVYEGCHFPYFVEYTFKFICSSTIIICLFVLLHNKQKWGKNALAIINHLDQLSLGIYIFNPIVLVTFFFIPGVLSVLRTHYLVGVPLLFVVSFFIPWLFARVFSQSKWLKWTIG